MSASEFFISPKSSVNMSDVETEEARVGFNTDFVAAVLADRLVVVDRGHHRIEVGQVLMEDALTASRFMVLTGMFLVLMLRGLQG